MADYAEKIRKKVDIEHGYRLGTAFVTRNKKYVYDTGTGKVFECEDEEYKILKELLIELRKSRNISFRILLDIIHINRKKRKTEYHRR